MTSLLLPRLAVASVWLYQGLWCKLLGRAPHHRRIVETTPWLNASHAHHALTAIGFFECSLAVWVLSGRWTREAAIMQTILLVAMNATGLLRARHLISDPMGMLLQNTVFLLLAWIAAGHFGCYAASL